MRTDLPTYPDPGPPIHTGEAARERRPVLLIVGVAVLAVLLLVALITAGSVWRALGAKSADLLMNQHRVEALRGQLADTTEQLTTAQADLDAAQLKVQTCANAIEQWRDLAAREGKAIVKVWGYANRWSFVISPLIQSAFLGLDASDIRDANRADNGCDAGSFSL